MDNRQYLEVTSKLDMILYRISELEARHTVSINLLMQIMNEHGNEAQAIKYIEDMLPIYIDLNKEQMQERIEKLVSNI